MQTPHRTSLKAYIGRRILQAIPLVLGVIVLSFILIHITPGDVVEILVGNTAASPAFTEALRHQLGLDQPLYVQFVNYMKNILTGNLGYSYYYETPVLTLILQRIPVTLSIVLPPLVVSSVLGVLLGVTASRKPYSAVDNVTSIGSLVGYSIPAFWTGELLLLVFAVKLRWFPVQGITNLGITLTGTSLYLNILWHLCLPAFLIGTIQVALITRLTRAGMLEAFTQDYITWARAKGVKERAVAFRHALRNAMLPVVTLTGYNFGFLLTGAVFTETIFGLPGLGQLLVSSITNRDFPVITGQLVFVSMMVIIANLVTDLAYGVVDPRVRYK